MKTLATCSPREFLKQSNKIRKAVAEWLSLTKVMQIRKNMPKLPDDLPEEEKREAIEKQVTDNFNAILDAVLDEHPDETAELLGLICFVEPDDLDNHRMTEFMGAVAEILNSREVLDFFISLVNLASNNGSAPAKA